LNIHACNGEKNPARVRIFVSMNSSYYGYKAENWISVTTLLGASKQDRFYGFLDRRRVIDLLNNNNRQSPNVVLHACMLSTLKYSFGNNRKNILQRSRRAVSEFATHDKTVELSLCRTGIQEQKQDTVDVTQLFRMKRIHHGRFLSCRLWLRCCRKYAALLFDTRTNVLFAPIRACKHSLYSIPHAEGQRRKLFE